MSLRPSPSRTATLVAVWLVGLAGIGVCVEGDGDAYSDGVARARAFGYAALVLLSASLCVSPLARWLPAGARLRRALGLLAACTALMHVELAIWSSPLSLAEQLADPTLRFGAGAFLVLVLLALTSFPRLVALLRLRSWKELHRLAYVAWCSALVHSLLAPYAWLRGLGVIAVLVLGLAPLRLWARPRRAPPES